MPAVAWTNYLGAGLFFQTVGTPLLAGRDFDDRDTATSMKVAIVNQAFDAQDTQGRQSRWGNGFEYTKRRESRGRCMRLSVS